MVDDTRVSKTSSTGERLLPFKTMGSPTMSDFALELCGVLAANR